MIHGKRILYIGLAIGVFVGLYLSSRYNYLLFHSLAEIFSILVACGIFVVAWNARRFLDNLYLLFIGIAYLFVGGLDLLHTLAYKGMGVFQGYGTDLPTQLWIAARYLESLSLLVAPLFLGRKLKVNFVFLGYSLAFSLLLGSIFYWNVFPTCFVEGTGLTSFKKVSEYVISVILCASIVALVRKRRDFDTDVLRLLITSICVTIGSEVAFTLYVHAYGFANLIGHYFKIVSFYLIYRAFIETGLRRPYSLLFRSLQESEERFRQLAENVRDVFWIGSPDWKEVLYISPTYEEVWCRSCESLYQQPHSWLDAVAEEDRERVIAEIDKKSAGDLSEPEFPEYRVVRPDGSVRWILARAFPIHNECGEIYRIAGIAEDITERKQAEEEIVRARDEWERTFDSVPDLIMILDNEHRIVRVNRATATKLGRNPAEVVGLHCYELIHGTDEPPSFCPHAALLMDGEEHSTEIHEDRLRGNFLLSVSPLRDGNGQLMGSVHVARDITQRKRQEEELRRYRDELQELVRERTAELQEQLRFERLISDLSAKFINVRFDRIDQEIESGLKQILDIFALDRCGIFEAFPERNEAYQMHIAVAENVGPVPMGINVVPHYPWIMSKVLSGQSVAIKTEDLPPEAAEDRERSEQAGSRYGVYIPLIVGGVVSHIISIHICRSDLVLSEDFIPRLRLLGEILVAALERGRSSNALQESETKYRIVADNTYDWAYWEGTDGTLLYVSPSCERVTGYAPDTFTGNPSLIREIIVSEDRDIWDRHRQESQEDGVRGEIQFRIRRRDGEVRWIEHACRAVRDDRDAFLGRRGSNRDITDRKTAEEEIRRKEHSLVEAQRIAHLGSWEYNYQNNEMTASDETFHISGLDPQQSPVAYETFLGLVHPDDREAVKAALSRTMEDPEAGYDQHYWLMRPDGAERFVHARGEIQRDETGRPVRLIGTMHDISEQKLAQNALQESKEALSKSREEYKTLAGKLLTVQEAERGRLARELHDDVTQRLAVMAIQTGKMEQQLQQASNPVAKQLKGLRDEIVKLAEDIHAISRQLHPSILDDLGLIDAIRSGCIRFGQDEGIPVHFRPSKVRENVPNDVALTLYRILQESLRNIAKHAHATQVRVSLTDRDNVLHLSIEDNGKGFDPEQARGKGGLGLASMEERADLIGGEFSIRSHPGDGTVVKVRALLPRE